MMITFAKITYITFVNDYPQVGNLCFHLGW